MFLLKWVGGAAPTVAKILTGFILFNLFLGVFNLLPIPPLDGSRMLAALLPDRYAQGLYRLERWGFLIIMLLWTFGLLRLVVAPLVILMAVFLARLMGVELVLGL